MIQSVGSQSAMFAMQAMRKPPEPQEMFSQFDVSGDDSLNIDELTEMLGQAPARPDGQSESAEEMMSRLDADSDGVLSFAEFEAGRPQGPPPGMPASEGGQGGIRSDLAALFEGGEEEDSSWYSNLELQA